MISNISQKMWNRFEWGGGETINTPWRIYIRCSAYNFQGHPEIQKLGGPEISEKAVLGVYVKVDLFVIAAVTSISHAAFA